MVKNARFKQQVRARMAETGENYTTARTRILAERLAAQPRGRLLSSLDSGNPETANPYARDSDPEFGGR
jgi:hypothetical protein